MRSSKNFCFCLAQRGFSAALEVLYGRIHFRGVACEDEFADVVQKAGRERSLGDFRIFCFVQGNDPCQASDFKAVIPHLLVGESGAANLVKL